MTTIAILILVMTVVMMTTRMIMGPDELTIKIDKMEQHMIDITAMVEETNNNVLFLRRQLAAVTKKWNWK